MNRRGFLAGIIAAGAAPAIVRASSLMQIAVPHQHILTGFPVFDNLRLIGKPINVMSFHGTATGRIVSSTPVFQQIPLTAAAAARELRKRLMFEQNYGEFRRVTTPLPDPFAHLFES